MTLFERKPAVINFYQQLLDDRHGLFSDEQKANLQRGKTQFEIEQFSIVIAGRFSAGKSQLINSAFLRTDVLPSKNAPTTCHPVNIRYGEENLLTLCGYDGHVETVANCTEDIKKALTDYGALYGEHHDRYQHLELSWNDSEILQNGVVLIDTIGTEDTEEKYIQKTYAAMEQASAVVFVFSADQAGTGTECQFIEKYLADNGKRLFLVINKADRLNSDADRKLVLDDFKKRLKPFFDERKIRVDDRIFMVSSTMETGLNEFREHSVSFIANDRFKELLMQHVGHLQQMLKTLEANWQSHHRDLQHKKDGNQKLLLENQQTIENLEDDLFDRTEELADMKQELIDQARSDLKTQISEIRDRVKPTLKKSDNSDRSELQDKIIEVVERLTRVNERIGHQLQRAIKETLGKRTRRVMGLDMDEFESHIPSINKGVITQTGKVVGEVSTAGGIASICYGLYEAVSAFTSTTSAAAAASATVASTTAQAGWVPSILSTLFGTGKVAATVAAATPAIQASPWLAALSAGGPVIAGGALISVVGYQFYQYREKQNQLKSIEQARQVISDMLKNAEKDLSKSIKEYVDEQVESQQKALKIEIEKEKKRLQAIISEKDLKVLQCQIDDTQTRLEYLDSYQNKLKALLP